MTPQLKIPAIPTLYKGRQYRSRLEARWAAFFDLLNWRHEYEPFDLDGWIPDFLIHGKERGSREGMGDGKENFVLVEIKPFTTIEQFDVTIAKIENALRETDYWGTEILLLGVAPSRETEEVYLGWLGQFFDGETIDEPLGIYSFDDAPLTATPGFCHSTQSFTDRISGIYDGGHIDMMEKTKADCLWNKATNHVMWNPPGGRQ